MKTNLRTFAVSVLSSSLIALGSSIAIAQTVNNIDNTTPGESGHGTNCSNHVGGCYATTFGTYQTSSRAGADSGMTTSTGTTMNTSNPALNPDNTTTGESGHGTGLSSPPVSSCLDAADATPGHCISGGTNK